MGKQTQIEEVENSVLLEHNEEFIDERVSFYKKSAFEVLRKSKIGCDFFSCSVARFKKLRTK